MDDLIGTLLVLLVFVWIISILVKSLIDFKKDFGLIKHPITWGLIYAVVASVVLMVAAIIKKIS